MAIRCKARSVAFLGLLLLLTWPSIGLSQEPGGKGKIQEKKEKLRELRRELQREREKAKETVKMERSLSQELSRIDELLERKGRELKGLQAKLKESEKRITVLNQEIGIANGKLRRARELLKRRLRAIYKQGQLGYLRLLLSAEGLDQMGRRMKYLQAIAMEDQRVARVYLRTISDLGSKRSELERYKADLNQNQRELKERQREIAEQRRKRGALLARVREEKAEHLRAIKDLEEASRQLQALISRLQAEERIAKKRGVEVPAFTGDSKFAGMKGRLPWPTLGSLTSLYGRQEHPKFRTITYNRGIGISAPEGREIAAVYDGVVLYADWFQGYGKLLIIDHGGGYFTLYAHASELLVKPGDKVAGRQIIAKVGDTGSLEGPQLYFEVRYRGKPEDPLSWLEQKR